MAATTDLVIWCCSWARALATDSCHASCDLTRLAEGAGMLYLRKVQQSIPVHADTRRWLVVPCCVKRCKRLLCHNSLVLCLYHRLVLQLP